MQAAKTLRSRPIDLEQDDLAPDQETPEQAMPSTGGSRETRMQKLLKQATIKAESEEAEDEVADDLGTDEDVDEEALDEDAEVRITDLGHEVLSLNWTGGALYTFNLEIIIPPSLQGRWQVCISSYSWHCYQGRHACGILE